MKHLFITIAAAIFALTACNSKPTDSGTDKPVTDSTVEENVDNTRIEQDADTVAIAQPGDTVRQKPGKY